MFIEPRSVAAWIGYFSREHNYFGISEKKIKN